MSAGVSGLAASIRGAGESETFDLGGHTASNITSTITSAFQEPFPLQDMIRVTFVTGAGKLGRQKYDEGAAKAVTAALRALGYEEDRGASCVVECGGSFKMQHDTGKNLKTVVVFPKILGTSGIDGDVAGVTISGEAETESLLPKGSPENMCAMSSKAVFERMLQSKCPSWAQKKGCAIAIDSVKKLIEELDEKLLSGTPLTDAEQELYDSVTISSLEEKEAFVKKQMHTQVEEGRLTNAEKELLLNQVSEKLDTISKEIALAEKEGKPKKAEKLRAAKTKAEERKKMLEKIEPSGPHQLRHESEIAKLRAELRPLQKIEDGAKGRLLSVKETQALAQKDEILEQIEQLEEASRGWFEDDDAFAVRVQASRSAFAAKEKQKGSKKSGSGSSGKSGGFKPVSSNKWVTPGARKSAAPAKSKNKKPAGGNVFAAMMESDSD